ncbi:MAG: cyclic nucleotide-binding domain-containing protein [Proteobacteria bacterium]|nr:cyclic nucleotide-binding domain-containing protein [Pseudomonadota bacterium]
MDFSDIFNYDGQAVPSGNGDSVFLANLPADDWSYILSFTQRCRFRAGEMVVRQGELSDVLYIVASGELDVLLTESDGEVRKISGIQPLSVFGEQAFLDGLPRLASVQAVTDSEMHLLTREAFDRLAARHPDLARQMLFDLGRIVSLRLREMMALAMRGSR